MSESAKPAAVRAVPLPHAESVPVCCLFKDGDSWAELMVLRKFSDDHWMTVDSDWVLVEDAPLREAAAQGPERCFFGDPFSPERFREAEASLSPEDTKSARWLRTSVEKGPLPGLAGRSPGKWCTGALFRPSGQGGDAVVEEEEPGADGDGEPSIRGAGNGALSRRCVRQLMDVARKLCTTVLSPQEFLLEALSTWQALVYHFERTALAAKAAVAADELLRQQRRYVQLTAAVGDGDGRFRGPVSFEESSSSEVEDDDVEEAARIRPVPMGSGSDTAEGDGTIDRSMASCTGEDTADEGREEKERRKKVASTERKMQLSAVESALSRCWKLLIPQHRMELLQEAASDVGAGLYSVLTEHLQLGEDVLTVEDVGLSGLLSRQCAEMALSLEKGRRSVGWNAAGVGIRLLYEFERQVWLSWPRSTTCHAAGRFTIHMWPVEDSLYPGPCPTASLCKRLRAWGRAVGSLRSKADAAAVALRPPQPSLLLRQPAASQRTIVSFVVCRWRDFASIAACCRRTHALVYEPGSWDGSVLRVSALMGRCKRPMGNIRHPQQQQQQQRRGGSMAFFARGQGPMTSGRTEHSTLGHAQVTLLRLGVSALAASPILLDARDTPFERLVRLFRIPGFAYDVCFRSDELVERMCLHLQSLGAAAAATGVWEHARAELRIGGPRERMSTVFAPRRPADDSPSQELPSMVVMSSSPLMSPMPRQRALGGLWYEHHFVEAAFGFDESASSTTYELFGMAFASSKTPRAGLPSSLVGQSSFTYQGVKLVVAGSGPSRAGGDEPPALAPGAYLDLVHEDEEGGAAQPPLPGWSPSYLRRGDRLGLAMVTMRGPGAGYRSIGMPGVKTRATGLVFVHQGHVVGGRWLPRPPGLAAASSLLLEAPLVPGGGSLTCLPTGACSGPPLLALLEALGPPPSLAKDG